MIIGFIIDETLNLSFTAVLDYLQVMLVSEYYSIWIGPSPCMSDPRMESNYLRVRDLTLNTKGSPPHCLRGYAYFKGLVFPRISCEVHLLEAFSLRLPT